MKIERLYGLVVSILVAFFCFESTEGSKLSGKHYESLTYKGKFEEFPRRRLSSADDALDSTSRKGSDVKEYHRVFAASIQGCIRKMTNGVRTMARFSKRQYKRTIDSIIRWTIGLLQSMQNRLKETIRDNDPAEPAPTISITSSFKDPISQSKKDAPVKQQATITKPTAASGTTEKKKQALKTSTPTNKNVQSRITTTLHSDTNLPRATSKASLLNNNGKKSIVEDLATVVPTVISSSKDPSTQSRKDAPIKQQATTTKPAAASATTERKKQTLKTSTPIDNNTQNKTTTTLHNGRNLTAMSDSKDPSLQPRIDTPVKQQATIPKATAVSGTTEKKQASKTSTPTDNNVQNKTNTTLHSGKNLHTATSKASLHNNDKKKSIMEDSQPKKYAHVKQQATKSKSTAASATTEKKQESKTSTPSSKNVQDMATTTLHSGRNLPKATSKASLHHHNNNKKKSIMEGLAADRSGGKSAFDYTSAAIMDEDETVVPAASYLGYLFPTLVTGLVFAAAGSIGYLWNGDWTEAASTVTGYFWGDDNEKLDDITIGGEKQQQQDAFTSSAIPITPDRY